MSVTLFRQWNRLWERDLLAKPGRRRGTAWDHAGSLPALLANRLGDVTKMPQLWWRGGRRDCVHIDRWRRGNTLRHHGERGRDTHERSWGLRMLRGCALQSLQCGSNILKLDLVEKAGRGNGWYQGDMRRKVLGLRSGYWGSETSCLHLDFVSCERSGGWRRIVEDQLRHGRDHHRCQKLHLRDELHYAWWWKLQLYISVQGRSVWRTIAWIRSTPTSVEKKKNNNNNGKKEEWSNMGS